VANKKKANGDERGTRYGRRCPYEDDEREKGEKRPKRRLEEKLRKYEVQAAGVEFIPALMFTLERYVEGVREDDLTDLERRLTRGENLRVFGFTGPRSIASPSDRSGRRDRRDPRDLPHAGPGRCPSRQRGRTCSRRSTSMEATETASTTCT
jgi:hypothetical protein